MMHELTINELVVERQYLLKLQSEKIQKCPVLSQLNALVRCHVVTRRVFESPKCDKCVWRPGSARTSWESLSAPPNPLAAIGGGVLL